MVPLSAIAKFSERATASAVNHQDAELATTISYNLDDGATLAQGQAAVRAAEASISMPINVKRDFCLKVMVVLVDGIIFFSGFVSHRLFSSAVL